MAFSLACNDTGALRLIGHYQGPRLAGQLINVGGEDTGPGQGLIKGRWDWREQDDE